MAPDEMFYQVGAFSPSEARKVLKAFEAQSIPFELESDHTALAKSGRWLQQQFGLHPEGSKLVVTVPESYFQKANTILRQMPPF